MMALTGLKKNFTAKAAAIGLGAMAAFTPLSSAYADSASKPPVITAVNTQPVLTDEQRARVDVLDEAWDFAFANPGHIAVSVLKGPDAGDRQGIELAGLLEKGIEKRYGIPSASYAGDNGSKPTEITFHYLMIDTDNSPLVRSAGPYNMGDALEKIPEVINGVKAANLYAGVDYTPTRN